MASSISGCLEAAAPFLKAAPMAAEVKGTQDTAIPFQHLPSVGSNLLPLPQPLRNLEEEERAKQQEEAAARIQLASNAMPPGIDTTRLKEVPADAPWVFVFDVCLQRPSDRAPDPPKPKRKKRKRTREPSRKAPSKHGSSNSEVEEGLAYVIQQAEKGRSAIVSLWKQGNTGTKKKAVPRTVPENIGLKVFELNFRNWLANNALAEFLDRDASRDPPASQGNPAFPFLYYRYKLSCSLENAQIQPGEGWKQAYHGTWFYALRSILHYGVLLESWDKEKGHKFTRPGLYLASCLAPSIWYARPHDLFKDGMFHRVIIEVLYDESKVLAKLGKAGNTLVLKSDAVAITGVIIQPNSPPYGGEERCEDWDDSLQILPPPRVCVRRPRHRRTSKQLSEAEREAQEKAAHEQAKRDREAQRIRMQQDRQAWREHNAEREREAWRERDEQRERGRLQQESGGGALSARDFAPFNAFGRSPSPRQSRRRRMRSSLSESPAIQRGRAQRAEAKAKAKAKAKAQAKALPTEEEMEQRKALLRTALEGALEDGTLERVLSEDKEAAFENLRQRLANDLMLAAEDGRLEQILTRPEADKTEMIRKKMAESMLAAAEDGRLEHALAEEQRKQDLERVRKATAASILAAAEDGRLERTLSNSEQRKQDLERLRKATAESILAAAEDGRLERTLSNSEQKKQDLERVRKATAESILAAAEDGRLERTLSSEQRKQDLERVRKAAAESILAAAEDGRLERTLSGEQRKQDLERVRKATAESILAAAEDGRLGKALTVERKKQDIEVVRQKAGATLLAAAESGRLEVVLAQRGEEVELGRVRKKIADGLLLAADDGTLEEALARTMQKSSDQHMEDRFVEDIRSRMATSLLEAVENGSLELAFQESGVGKAPLQDTASTATGLPSDMQHTGIVALANQTAKSHLAGAREEVPHGAAAVQRALMQYERRIGTLTAAVQQAVALRVLRQSTH
ncbi:Ckb [Symbiodinium microadriaticum]|nr:Ckb [Symbiodinium microadriaticum]